MKEQSLYEKLKAYSDSDAYPFHMPGHKRNKEMPSVYRIDITEIDGFDNLHHPEGILKDAQERLAKLYGAGESFFLINGSSCGLLAAVFACTTQRGKILMARNSHKAVYHAAQLRELQTVYLLPESICGADGYWQGRAQVNGPIRPEDVEVALQKDPEIEAVLVTSPTYDGIVSDIEKIAEIAHRYQKYLIVDEAHGAHFGFHPFFPQRALQAGADIVINSLHKTLPSMTQTAALHVRKGMEQSCMAEDVRMYLGMFQSSSPSYVLMASMDGCVRLMEEQGEALMEAYAQRLKRFRAAVRELSHIHVLEEEGICQDPGKLVIAADGLCGRALGNVLRSRFHLEMEMEAGGYVIALTSLADTDEGFDRLLEALQSFDREITETSDTTQVTGKERTLPKQHCTIAEAAAAQHRSMELQKAAGEVSAEYIYLYPPGIPLVTPGEILTKEILAEIRADLADGLEIQGLRDYSAKMVDVLGNPCYHM